MRRKNNGLLFAWGRLMDKTLWRAYLIELIGTFALVYFGAGVVCVNHMTLPTKARSAANPPCPASQKNPCASEAKAAAG